MTITLNTATPITLCHGLASRGVVGQYYGPLGEGQTSAAWAVPYSRPIRAAAAIPIDRGQCEYSFNIKVQTTFATEITATYFRLTHAASIPRGAHTITVAATGMSDVTYPGAVLEAIEVTQLGIECEIIYSFKTQAPVPTLPEEE